MTTPNTNPADLDRDALIKVIDALYDEAPSSPYDSGATSDGWCRACEAIKDAIAALPPASGAEPVAKLRDALKKIAYLRPPGDCKNKIIVAMERIALHALEAAPTPPSASDEKLGRFGHHPDPAIDFEVEVQALEDEFSNLQAGFTNGTPPMAEIKVRVFRAMDFRVGGDLGAIRAKAALRTLEARMKAASAPPSASSGDTKPLTFMYRNWRGEVSERHANPISVRWGSTEWHPEPQWLMLAFDIDKQAEREFALLDIGVVAPCAERGAGLMDTNQLMRAVARGIDETLNPHGKRIGFVLLVVPFEQPHGARTNYVSNCDRQDILTALKEVVARFEGQPEQKGSA